MLLQYNTLTLLVARLWSSAPKMWRGSSPPGCPLNSYCHKDRNQWRGSQRKASYLSTHMHAPLMYFCRVQGLDNHWPLVWYRCHVWVAARMYWRACSETTLTGESRFHISTPQGIWTQVPCDGKQRVSPLDQWDMVRMKWDCRLSTELPPSSRHRRLWSRKGDLQRARNRDRKLC